MALPDLVDSADVTARLGRELTARETARLPSVLADVSAMVRTYVRQMISPAESTVTLPVRFGIVTLPERPVQAVTAVVDENDLAVLYEWVGDDQLEVATQVIDTFAWEPYRSNLTAVTVTYEHGFDEVPADIVAVVCSVALRALGQEPDRGAVQTEAIAGYSYTLGVIGASGPVGLLPDEKAVLDAYRHYPGVIRMRRQ